MSEDATPDGEALHPTHGARIELRLVDAPASYAVTLWLPDRRVDGRATVDHATGACTLDVDDAPAWLVTYASALLRQLWGARRADAAPRYPARLLRWRAPRE